MQWNTTLEQHNRPLHIVCVGIGGTYTLYLNHCSTSNFIQLMDGTQTVWARMSHGRLVLFIDIAILNHSKQLCSAYLNWKDYDSFRTELRQLSLAKRIECDKLLQFRKTNRRKFLTNFVVSLVPLFSIVCSHYTASRIFFLLADGKQRNNKTSRLSKVLKVLRTKWGGQMLAREVE